LVKGLKECTNIMERLVQREKEPSAVDPKEVRRLEESVLSLNKIIRGEAGEDSLLVQFYIIKRDVAELKKNREEGVKTWIAAVMMVASIIISFVLAKVFK